MTEKGGGERLDGERAVALLRERLPEFAPAIDEHREDFGELLFHLLMGDLARFYMSQALNSLALQRRFWMTVDRLAACGDDAVQNAIGVSLIEWFAWGNDRERATLGASPEDAETRERLVPEPRAATMPRVRVEEVDDRGAGGAAEDERPHAHR